MLSSFLRRLVHSSPRTFLKEHRAIAAWRAQDCPLPPPAAFKRRTIREYARRFGLSVLVETGTYHGDTLLHCRGCFQELYSIELDEALYRRAVQRLGRYREIRLLHGDSGELLPQVLETIDKPALFWLDGHFSGGETARGHTETPILAELTAIFRHRTRGHVILIDDARVFDGQGDYPALDRLEERVRRHLPQCVFETSHDIIRIHEPAVSAAAPTVASRAA